MPLNKPSADDSPVCQIFESQETQMTTANDYKVADMSDAEWGRKELTIAEYGNAWPDGRA